MLETSVYNASYALFLADTGLNGLNNSAGNQYVRGGWHRLRDPSNGPDRTTNGPFVVIEVDFEPIDTTGKQSARINLTFHVYASRDTAFGETTAVIDRIQSVFSATAMGVTNGWTFSAPGRFKKTEGPTTSAWIHDRLECVLFATTGGALDTGSDGSFTWTASGGMTLTTNFQGAWTLRPIIRTVEMTPWGWRGVRRVTTMVDCDGTVAYLSSADDGTAPIPDGVVGTLVLTRSTGRSYTFKALMSTLDTEASNFTNAQQVNTYRFVLSAQSEDNPFTVNPQS